MLWLVRVSAPLNVDYYTYPLSKLLSCSNPQMLVHTSIVLSSSTVNDLNHSVEVAFFIVSKALPKVLGPLLSKLVSWHYESLMLISTMADVSIGSCAFDPIFSIFIGSILPHGLERFEFYHLTASLCRFPKRPLLLSLYNKLLAL